MVRIVWRGLDKHAAFESNRVQHAPMVIGRRQRHGMRGLEAKGKAVEWPEHMRMRVT